MKVHYLEFVTPDVDSVCTAYAAALQADFGPPVAALGNARTATVPDGTLVGVRAPLRADEAPVVRPYWDSYIVPRYRYRPEDDRVAAYGPPVVPVIRYGAQEIVLPPWAW